MTKAIFYDSIGGWMHKCMFAGLDKEGRAQWMMVDQGAEVMMLDDYLDIGEVCGELNLLCLMGEEVESSTMALLLGAVVQSYGPDIPSQLSYCNIWTRQASRKCSASTSDARTLASLLRQTALRRWTA